MAVEANKTKECAIHGSALVKSLTTREQCGRLKDSKNTTVALQAAYKDLELADGRTVDGFVKFVEDRCHFRMPSVVESRIAEEQGLGNAVRAPNEDADSFVLTKEIRAFNRIWRVPQAVRVANSTSAVTEITSHDQTLRLTRKISDQISSRYECMAFTRYQGTTFIATAGSIGMSSELICLSKTGDVNWTSHVWGNQAQNQIVSTGSESNVLGVIANDDGVVVFGICRGLFFEGFDRSSGRPLFRFSSVQWHGGGLQGGER